MNRQRAHFQNSPIGSVRHVREEAGRIMIEPMRSSPRYTLSNWSPNATPKNVGRAKSGNGSTPPRLAVERGDIYHVDLNPIKGRERAGPRYALVVTRKAFNNLGTPLVCPITQGGDFALNAGFAVSLIGAGT
ncbi:MAG: type II toxin-antitoxin system PemK/MazF family toxin [Acidobacteriota bacterium]|nr:type II toxin-antitoxin system PemK/MazF family toxin [Acidobacteriota bacterium]